MLKAPGVVVRLRRLGGVGVPGQLLMNKRPTSSRPAALGFEFAAAVAGFSLFGYWLGRYFEQAALGIVIGAALGVIGGMYNLIRASMAASGGAAERERNSDGSVDG